MGYPRYKIIVCCDCGMNYKTRGTRTVRCPDCQELKNQKSREERKRLQKEGLLDRGKPYILIHDPEKSYIEYGLRLSRLEIFSDRRIVRQCFAPGTIFKYKDGRKYVVVVNSGMQRLKQVFDN